MKRGSVVIMQCKSCGAEWRAEQQGLCCPFCGTDNRMTAAQLSRLMARIGEESDENAHVRLLCTAAEQGNPEAQYAYGLRLAAGQGVRCSLPDAVVWYRAAARQGHADAAYALYTYLAGDSAAAADPDTLRFWLTAAAELGCAPAQLALSEQCEDKTHALYWQARSAAQSYVPAMLRMAEYYGGADKKHPSPYAKWYYTALARTAHGYERALRRLREVEQKEPPAVTLPGRADGLLALGVRARELREYALAYRFFSEAAQEGCAASFFELAECMRRGLGCPQDETQAFYSYREAAQSGDRRARLALADCYRDGIGVPRDKDEAIRLYTEAAEAGDAAAQCLLGEIYFDGKLVPRDIPLAMRWYERAAQNEAGPSREAAARIHHIYAGIGETYNRGIEAQRRGCYAEAVELYTVASELGHGGAACNLGYCYQLGLGVSRDLRRAAQCYRRAAENGSAPAALNLGLCCRAGAGTRRDFRAADYWLRRAAAEGYEDASRALASMERARKRKQARRLYAASAVVYERGDVREALRLRQRAAMLGDASACFVVGCHYEFGDGVPVDRARADSWYEKAERCGYHDFCLKERYLKNLRRLQNRHG